MMQFHFASMCSKMAILEGMEGSKSNAMPNHYDSKVFKYLNISLTIPLS